MKKSTKKAAKKAAPAAAAASDKLNDGVGLGNINNRIKVVEEKVQYIFNNARADVYNIRRELVKEIIHTMKEETSELSGTYSTTGKELTNMSHSMEQDLHMLKEMHRELPMMRAKVNELRENIQNFSRNNETEDEKPTKKGRK
jgi:hypothetical protein